MQAVNSIPLQRTDLSIGGQAETVVDEVRLRDMSFETSLICGTGHVGLVNDEEEVLGK